MTGNERKKWRFTDCGAHTIHSVDIPFLETNGNDKICMHKHTGHTSIWEKSSCYCVSALTCTVYVSPYICATIHISTPFHLGCFLIASHCCTVSRIHGVHNVMLLGYISTGEQHTARQRTTNMRIRNKNKIIIIDIHVRDISSWNILLVFKHNEAKKKKKIRRRRRHTAY